MLQYNSTVEGQLSIGASYEYEFLTDPLYGSRSIPNINRERTNNTATSLFVNYGLTNKFSLTLFVPFRSVTNEKVLFRGQNEDQYNGGKYTRHASGLGDIVMLLNYAPPQFAKLPALLVSAGVKLANASVDATDKYGERFSDNLQIGSGSVDPVFAITLAQNLHNLIFSAQAFTRITMRENIYGYKYGNELHGILSADYPGELFYGGLRLNYLLVTRDHYQYGKITRERGGTWLYVAPKLGIKVLDNLDFDISIPFAVYQNVNESQLTSSYQIQINTVYHLTL